MSKEHRATPRRRWPRAHTIPPNTTTAATAPATASTTATTTTTTTAASASATATATATTTTATAGRWPQVPHPIVFRRQHHTLVGLKYFTFGIFHFLLL